MKKQIEELKKQQESLDKTQLICPKCGEELDWWFYRNWGCQREFIEHMARTGNYERLEY